jgi:hypothetical protein
MTSEWFMRVDGKTYGPLTSTKLQTLAADGKIAPQTEVAKFAAGPWHPAAKVAGLFPAVAPAPPPLPPAARVNNATLTPKWYRRWWAIFLLYPFLAFVGCGVFIQLTVPKETLDRWKAEAAERNQNRAVAAKAQKAALSKELAARNRGENAGHQAGYLWSKLGKRKPDRVTLEVAARMEAEKAIPSNLSLIGSGSDEERRQYARGYVAGFAEGFDKAN